MKTLPKFLFVLCSAPVLLGLASCTPHSPSPPPLAAVPAEPGVDHVDFKHKGKYYRLKLAAKHSEIVENGSAKVKIEANGKVLGWDAEIEQYGDDPMGWTCRSTKQFGVRILGSKNLRFSESGASEGSGSSGVEGMIVVMRRINLESVPGTDEESLNVNALVQCDLVSIKENDGDSRRVLHSATVPLRWQVFPSPASAKGIKVAAAP